MCTHLPVPNISIKLFSNQLLSENRLYSLNLTYNLCAFKNLQFRFKEKIFISFLHFVLSRRSPSVNALPVNNIFKFSVFLGQRLLFLFPYWYSLQTLICYSIFFINVQTTETVFFAIYKLVFS